MMKPDTISQIAAEPKPAKIRSGRASANTSTSAKKIRLVRNGGSTPVLHNTSVINTTAALCAARASAPAAGPRTSHSATPIAAHTNRFLPEKSVRMKSSR